MQNDVYVDSEDGRFSTFHDETVAEIEKGVRVRFEAKRNGQHWNIVDDSVDILEDEESEVYGGMDEPMLFGLDDARISSQSLVRSSVMFHQDRDGSTVEEVEKTAHELADLQIELTEKLRNAGRGVNR